MKNTALTPVEMVLVTLRFLATGSILQIIGDFNGIDKSTASQQDKDTKLNRKIFLGYSRRFPVSALGIHLDVNKVEAIVVACAVLHNIACQVDEPELQVDQDVEDAIQVANCLNLDDPPDIHIGFNMNNVARYNLITQYFQGLL
ncbi:hypothetical protein NQ314_000038 [Rhamnusium bicolor]|uniref:DDE Tnp4 domain-containing protein n=1 Tax=Rhamnusium bicolor TaxID=1586634 RepID=A0AAV8ZY21_9CUCU|nr:hypothetical protein NQ314_000038 [Rhamnusium bicolor]